jgi:hypothetical protein
MKAIAIAMAGGIAALVLAGMPALASSHAAASRSVTGPEVLTGTVHGHQAVVGYPKIPLRLRGVVTAHGSVVLVQTQSVVKTPAGILFADTAGRQQKPVVSRNSTTCRAQATVYLTGKVNGRRSTGAFAGASGPFAMQVYFAAYEPRYTSGQHKGQCNFSGNVQPLSKGAVASVLTSVVITLP